MLFFSLQLFNYKWKTKRLHCKVVIALNKHIKEGKKTIFHKVHLYIYTCIYMLISRFGYFGSTIIWYLCHDYIILSLLSHIKQYVIFLIFSLRLYSISNLILFACFENPTQLNWLIQWEQLSICCTWVLPGVLQRFAHSTLLAS